MTLAGGGVGAGDPCEPWIEVASYSFSGGGGVGAFFLRCPHQPRLPRLLSVNSWVSKTFQSLDQYPVTLHIEVSLFSRGVFQLLPEGWRVPPPPLPQSRTKLRRTLGNSFKLSPYHHPACCVNHVCEWVYILVCVLLLKSYMTNK